MYFNSKNRHRLIPVVTIVLILGSRGNALAEGKVSDIEPDNNKITKVTYTQYTQLLYSTASYPSHDVHLQIVQDASNDMAVSSIQDIAEPKATIDQLEISGVSPAITQVTDTKSVDIPQYMAFSANTHLLQTSDFDDMFVRQDSNNRNTIFAYTPGNSVITDANHEAYPDIADFNHDIAPDSLENIWQDDSIHTVEMINAVVIKKVETEQKGYDSTEIIAETAEDDRVKSKRSNDSEPEYEILLTYDDIDYSGLTDDYDAAEIIQIRDGIYLKTTQIGRKNIADIIQTGHSNQAYIYQNGVSNIANIIQSGISYANNPNFASITQRGNSHSASIRQSGGSGNYAQIVQSD